MDHGKDRNYGSETANQIAQRNAREARVVMRRAAVGCMADSEPAPRAEPRQQEFNFCPKCEWVRLMNPEGLGYCKEHGDIEPSE